MAPRTLTEKIWDAHVVHAAEGEPDLIFIDLHLLHEVTSPQAFDGLRLAGRTVRRPDLTVATADHNVPTTDIDKPVADPISAQQLKVLDDNTAEFGITCYPDGTRQPGHRPHHRARAGLDAARHDDRLRRQPHLHARRLRCARLRHRDERGGARPGHPDAAPGAPEDDGRDGGGRPRTRRDRQGRGAGHHRHHRHRRRYRPRHRVPGVGDPEPVHGGPDDAVQHVDRRRRTGGPGGARRDDLRLREGPRPRPSG